MRRQPVCAKITSSNNERKVYMKICPYLTFGGNCAEAIAHYEKAFDAKAEVMRYKDAPPESGYQVAKETENFIMHARLEMGGAAIMLSDMPPENPVNAGDNIAVMAEFDDADKLEAAFNTLKAGGQVHMELQETFWSKRFGSVTDKFGIGWNLTLGQQ